MKQTPTFVGTVENVDGFTVSIQIADEASVGLTFVDGNGYRVGQVGTFLRIPLGYDDIFGIVSKVGASAAPQRDDDETLSGNRWITLQLIGEADRAGYLKRGLSQYPTVGDEVHIVTEEHLSRIYNRPDSAEHIRVGSVVGSERIPSLVNINQLVNRHSAILGTTGSGKSTTVAGILHRISSVAEFQSPRIFLVDIHGEYAQAMGDIANVFRVRSNLTHDENPLHIPYWALTFDELLSVTLGGVNNETDRRRLMGRVVDAKREALDELTHIELGKDEITADTPIPFSIHKLWFDLYHEVIATHIDTGDQGYDTIAYVKDEDGNPIDKGDAMEVRPPKTLPQDNSADADPKVFLSQSSLNIRRQLESLASRLRDPRYEFLFKPGAWLPNSDGVPDEDLDGLLKSWLGHDSGITILDLSGVPPAVLDTMVGGLLRIVFDSLFWARNTPEGGRERPLLLVLEEAHSYVGKDAANYASDAVGQIAKEGRKYGIGLMLVSQRPSEIDSTILSQCGTIFAMRLGNSEDRNNITSSLSDNLTGVLDMLPVLRTGEAIITGLAVRIPTRTKIDPPPEVHQPESDDPLVYAHQDPGGWDQARVNPNYEEVVRLWRKEDIISSEKRNIEGGEER